MCVCERCVCVRGVTMCVCERCYHVCVRGVTCVCVRGVTVCV